MAKGAVYQTGMPSLRRTSDPKTMYRWVQPWAHHRKTFWLSEAWDSSRCAQGCCWRPWWQWNILEVVERWAGEVWKARLVYIQYCREISHLHLDCGNNIPICCKWVIHIRLHHMLLQVGAQNHIDYRIDCCPELASGRTHHSFIFGSTHTYTSAEIMMCLYLYY